MSGVQAQQSLALRVVTALVVALLSGLILWFLAAHPQSGDYHANAFPGADNAGPALHALVHNAGVLPPERTETDDGHELTVATHVLGPHLLTSELRPLLAAGTDARVVFVSSGGMYTAPLRTDDPEFRQGTYSGNAAYARTKRMQVVLAELLADDLAGDGTVVHSMHPGWADTPGVASSMPGFHKLTGPLLRTSEQGADTAVWLTAATEPGRCTGLFWHDRAPRPTHYLPRTGETPAARAALWNLCVEAARQGGAPGRDS